MSSKSRKYCSHAVCVKMTELYYVYCCAYFAVVSSTNRLTRLFSRVLKYCGERRGFQSGNLTTTDTKPCTKRTTTRVPEKGPTAVLPPEAPGSVSQWGLSMTSLLKPQFARVLGFRCMKQATYTFTYFTLVVHQNLFLNKF